jgi:hypothetical protein
MRMAARRITVQFSEDEYQHLVVGASIEDRPVASFVRTLVREALLKRGPAQPIPPWGGESPQAAREMSAAVEAAVARSGPVRLSSVTADELAPCDGFKAQKGNALKCVCGRRKAEH